MAGTSIEQRLIDIIVMLMHPSLLFPAQHIEPLTHEVGIEAPAAEVVVFPSPLWFRFPTHAKETGSC